MGGWENKITKKIGLVETHMAMGKGISLFTWIREVYVCLNKELETLSEIF